MPKLRKAPPVGRKFIGLHESKHLTYMRFIFLIACLFIFQITIGQIDYNKVDTSNYYEFYKNNYTNIKGKQLATNWLRLNEVTPIIVEEMENSGYETPYSHTILKLDTQYIVLTVYYRNSNFGFLYITGHSSLVEKENRKRLTQDHEWGTAYIETILSQDGSQKFIRIKKIPDNIFVLNENNYWYQYSEETIDNNKLITKDIALKILRQDIKAYLSKAPKPIK